MQKEFRRANVSCIWDYVNQTSGKNLTIGCMNDLDCNKSPEVIVKSVVDVSVVL